jgi:hypothetical protein
MILITGMPRSGTSFLRRMFIKYGQKMVPKICSHNVKAKQHGQEWSLGEPAKIAKSFRENIRGEKLLKIFRELEMKNKNNDFELVLKSPQLSFLTNELLFFNKIIICVREDIEYWKKSVFFHNKNYLGIFSLLTSLIIEPIKGLSPEERLEKLGILWKNRCYRLKEFLEEKAMIFRYGNKNDFVIIMKNFHIDETEAYTIWKLNWRKSSVGEGKKCQH